MSKRPSRNKVIEQVRARLKELRASEGYGTHVFVLGETNSLIWVLSIMGDPDE